MEFGKGGKGKERRKSLLKNWGLVARWRLVERKGAFHGFRNIDTFVNTNGAKFAPTYITKKAKLKNNFGLIT